jgi:hypothetical protein
VVRNQDGVNEIFFKAQGNAYNQEIIQPKMSAQMSIYRPTRKKPNVLPKEKWAKQPTTI